MNLRAGWLGVLCGMGLAAAVNAAESGAWPLAEGQACVAYRTYKDTLLARDVEVLGRNCGIKAELERDPAAGRLRVRVTVPVDGFDSGSGRRDRHVAELLGGASREPVRFISQWLSQEALAALQSGGAALTGDLLIRGAAHPVTLQVAPLATASGTVLRARLATTFAQLGVTVPAVGPGGMIARPKADVELLGQLPLPPELASLAARHE